MSSYAWLIVWFLGSMASSAAPDLEEDIGYFPTVAAYVVLGLGLAWLWNRLYRRPFAERLRSILRVVAVLAGLLVAFAVVVVLAEVIGADAGSVEFNAAGWDRPAPDGPLPFVVVAGLWLLDRRRDRRRTREPTPTSSRLL